MKACGADLGEIVIFDQHHREADLLETLSMREGTEGELLRVLREGVKLHGIRLVIIDTLTAFTPARVDGHEAVAVRQMMKPLARFASDCGVGGPGDLPRPQEKQPRFDSRGPGDRSGKRGLRGRVPVGAAGAEGIRRRKRGRQAS